MNAPIPVVFIVTVILALVAGAVTEPGTTVVTVYTGDPVDAVWHEETGGIAAPVDRRIAVVFSDDGKTALATDQPEIKTALDRIEVDFENEVLFVAYMGAQPTGGYGIRIASVQTNERQLQGFTVTARLDVWTPHPEDTVTQGFTHPVDIGVFPRDEWPEGVLRSIESRTTPIEVTDQDGRIWGPAFIY